MHHPFCQIAVCGVLAVLFAASSLPAQTTTDMTVSDVKKMARSFENDEHGNIVSLDVRRHDGCFGKLTGEHFEGLGNLKSLTIDNDCSDKLIATVAQNSKLERLAITHSHHLTDEGLKSIGKIESLRELCLRTRNVTSTGLLEIGKLKQLRKLTLFTLAATDETIECLSHCPHLESLRLVEPNLTNDSAKVFGNIPTLKTLDLCAVYRLEFTGGFSGRDRETMWSTQITDDGLIEIGKLKNLEFLALTNTSVGDGLRHLRELKKLRTLILDKTEVCDEDLTHLTHFSMLEDLGLVDTNLTNAATETLLRIPKLRFLQLYGTEIADKNELRGKTKDVGGDRSNSHRCITKR